MTVDIIDIGLGNVSSVKNWLTKSNISSRKVIKAKDLESNLLILPGVGSARLYMERLKENKFDIAIRNHINSGRRLIGICLGFQILFEKLEEDGHVKGFGFFSGNVVAINKNKDSNTGWGKFEFNKKQLSYNWKNQQYSKSRKKIIKGRVFYNHSFGVLSNHSNTRKIPNYSDYISMISSENILGFQFHPEKSQITGKELIELIF